MLIFPVYNDFRYISLFSFNFVNSLVFGPFVDFDRLLSGYITSNDAWFTSVLGYIVVFTLV